MFAKRCLLVVVMLTLLLLLVPACGGGGDETPTTYTATPTPTYTTTSTPTATASTQPVKIGAIESWSGPAAISGTAYADPVIKFVEKQVNDAGGIMGGRPIKVVKYDNRASVAEATAGARKLVIDDKVSILSMGGISAAEFAAVADAADELKVPYVSLAGFPGIEESAFTWQSSPNDDQFTTKIVDWVSKLVQPKPKTAAYIHMQDPIRIARVGEESRLLEADGIQTVYMQDIPYSTSDFSPYLTKIKYYNPDVLVTNLDSEWAVTVAKQIMELGGWGNIKVIGLSQSTSAAKFPGAEGWTIVATWVPGLGYPTSQKYEQDWDAIIGRAPTSNFIYFYVNLLMAVEAVRFAGSEDPIKINQGLASGNLQFDTPMGMAHVTNHDEPGLKYMYAQIQKGGTIVPFKQ